jgi:SDR family mycofactocin-dependent oxidoreductase
MNESQASTAAATGQRLRGKVAFITGAARGQGRAIAKKFASEGADIVVCDICRPLRTCQYPGATEADLEETRNAVEATGRGCLAEVADVRDQVAIEKIVSRALERFGGIDIVSANAGLATWIPFWELTEEQWCEVVDVNLTGVFHTLKPVVPHMMQRLSGCIIITSSVNGREPGKGVAHYTAAKHGVLGLMKNLALELGQFNIRVNAVLPSVVNTVMANNPTNSEWIFRRRDATEEEFLAATRNWHALRARPAMNPSVVADAMIWLASDEAQHITGIELPVDAGHLILPGFNHDVVDRVT